MMKKVILGLMVIAVTASAWPAGLIRADQPAEDNLQFSVDSGKIYFFQPETGRIFVYQTTTNRLSRVLTLEKLGQELKQSRSLITIEEREEEEE